MATVFAYERAVPHPRYFVASLLSMTGGQKTVDRLLSLTAVALRMATPTSVASLLGMTGGQKTVDQLESLISVGLRVAVPTSAGAWTSHQIR